MIEDRNGEQLTEAEFANMDPQDLIDKIDASIIDQKPPYIIISKEDKAPRGYVKVNMEELLSEEQQNTEKVKTKEKAPEERMTGKEEPYAYTITDKTFGELKVLNTSNGWWKDKEKVQHLIDAYKIDANDDEACAYAGIRRINLQYFQELHPDFLYIKRACHQVLGLKAKSALAKKVEESPEWYLERKRKDEYSPRIESTGPNGRDLYDPLAKEIKEIGEALLNGNDNTTKEHPSELEAGDAHAGQGGGADEAEAPAPIGEQKEIPPVPSEKI